MQIQMTENANAYGNEIELKMPAEIKLQMRIKYNSKWN